MSETRFFGKGRVQVSCPAVLGDGSLSWAMPSVPYAGSGVGLFLVPPQGANVWVEFEGGDPGYPIIGGCFWGPGEAPAVPALAEMKVLRTDGATITLNDLPGVGGVTIELASGAKISMTATGVEITNGTGATIKMSGPQVTVNNGALEVL
ncbi:MAG: phage baseplate assembly protein V [Gemmatimonadaceae bacterium]|nr:phage baseplate assembly protein V [Gemmatimonadaceae bacterium]